MWRRLSRRYCLIFAITCYKTVHTTNFDIAFLQHFVPPTCPTKFNKLTSLQHDCCRDKVAEKFTLQDLTIIRTHEGTCCWEHVPALCSCVCTLSYFVATTFSRYMSLLHVSCEQCMVLSLQHALATCPCIMTPHVQGALELIGIALQPFDKKESFNM